MIEGKCHCGALSWTFAPPLESATACNCTVCRRYGALWAYDYLGEGITVSGPTRAYHRESRYLDFHFCPTCGCVGYWLIAKPDAEGRWRIAVNLRLAEPEAVDHALIDHFDGLNSFDDLPRDGKCVADYWF
jgi:hypothetical protein